MSKKAASIIFISIVIFVFLSIALLNFFVDPYKVFLNKDVMDSNNIPINYLNIILKAYKNQKSDTLFIGGSETRSLFKNSNIFNFYKLYFNVISINFSSYETQYYLLKNYIKLHPETKNVFLFMTNNGLSVESITPDIEIIGNNDNFNLEELIFLLISKDTTKKNIKFLKDNYLNLNYISKFYKQFNNCIKNKNFELFFNNKKEISFDGILNFMFYYKRLPMTYDNDSIINNFNSNFQKNIYYIEKSIQLLKDNKINFYIIIPPNHAVSQSFIYMNPEIQKKYEIFKKVCVENSDNNVYDFSIINNYTAIDFNNNFLFEDYWHPNQIYGLKIFKVLHNNISENNLYVELNKKDFDKQIENERNLVKKYVDNNKKLLEKYMNKLNNGNEMTSTLVYFDNAPEYIKKEADLYKYNFKKANENYKKGTVQLGKFNNKFYTEIEK